MRVILMCLGLFVAATAHGQRNKEDDTSAAKRACSAEDCFFERDVRDFEVIDETHVIVYTGSQRCAFHLELRGTLCDLTFAPELYFSRLGEIRETVATEPTGRVSDPFGAVATARNRRDLRICANDLSVQVHGGKFTETAGNENVPTDRFGNPRTDCRVATVEAITDDQLVELYVARGVVPPPPPMGAGQIEVGEQEEQPDDERE
jgi:hypothetical protein